jgi:hypothetical protein
LLDDGLDAYEIDKALDSVTSSQEEKEFREGLRGMSGTELLTYLESNRVAVKFLEVLQCRYLMNDTEEWTRDRCKEILEEVQKESCKLPLMVRMLKGAKDRFSRGDRGAKNRRIKHQESEEEGLPQEQTVVSEDPFEESHDPCVIDLFENDELICKPVPIPSADPSTESWVGKDRSTKKCRDDRDSHSFQGSPRRHSQNFFFPEYSPKPSLHKRRGHRRNHSGPFCYETTSLKRTPSSQSGLSVNITCSPAVSLSDISSYMGQHHSSCSLQDRFIQRQIDLEDKMANLERDNEAVKKELAAANARVEELEQCFKSLLAERNDKEHGELQNVASKQMKQALETLCQAMGLKIAGHMDNM